MMFFSFLGLLSANYCNAGGSQRLPVLAAEVLGDILKSWVEQNFFILFATPCQRFSLC